MPEDKLAKALKSRKTDHIPIWRVGALMNGLGLLTAYDSKENSVPFV